MYLAKNRIRVIKRQEREQQQEADKRVSGGDTAAERNTREAKQHDTVFTVKEWVNDFLRRRQHRL